MKLLCAGYVFIGRIHRHSKSLDVNSKVCGYCGAPFQLLYSKSQSSVPRTLNQFALFVKENYASIKRSQPGLKHAEVMSAIKTQYQRSKSEKKPITFSLDNDDDDDDDVKCKLMVCEWIMALSKYFYTDKFLLQLWQSFYGP